MSAMHVGVSVHNPQVRVVHEVQRDAATHTTIVELGRQDDDGTATASATLFLDSAEVVSFVTDLVQGIDGASPGFLLELLNELVDG